MLETISTLIIMLIITAFAAFAGYVIIASEHHAAGKHKNKRSKSK